MKNSKKYQTEKKKKYNSLKWKNKLKARKEAKRAAQQESAVPRNREAVPPVVNIHPDENQDPPSLHPPTCVVTRPCTSCGDDRRPTVYRTIEEEAMLKVIVEENQRTTVESYSANKNEVLPPLARHAKALEDAFNSLEGVMCDKAKEGMILFLRIQFPHKAIKAAEAAQTAPDAFYAKHLLKATGIVVSPGSDFGHVPGIWFVGLSILLQEEKIQQEEISVVIRRLTDFHQAFMVEFHD